MAAVAIDRRPRASAAAPWAPTVSTVLHRAPYQYGNSHNRAILLQYNCNGWSASGNNRSELAGLQLWPFQMTVVTGPIGHWLEKFLGFLHICLLGFTI